MTTSHPASTSSAYRLLIVDDEPIARAHLKKLIDGDPEITVIGESSDGLAAVQAIRALAPDIVLLDVQMPEIDGFGVVREIGPLEMPPVIFVTAHDTYAIQAFEISAVDYVMKPIARERLTLALQRAKARCHTNDIHAHDAPPSESPQLQRLLEYLHGVYTHPRDTDNRIALRVDGRTVLVGADTITWLEAVDDYVRVRLGGSSGKTAYLVRSTMTAFEHRLPSNFLRVHRSAIVNTDQVREIHPSPQGEYVVVLLNGSRIPTGRSYRANVAAFLQSFTDRSP